MTVFTFSCFSGAAIGPAFSGYIEMSPGLGWRWIEWVQLMCAAMFISITFPEISQRFVEYQPFTCVLFP